ncbi:MAG: hypothetical protein BWY90_01686 [Deltaproteobacteria bacterium ADurb.BinA014]|nr:MAG: hypothetical protein BWY90_01686 [Deltaproteobacteria bacterium ADurb.BinA014]
MRNCRVHAAKAELYRGMPRRRVHNRVWYQYGVYDRRALSEQRFRKLYRDIRRTKGTAQNNADTVAIILVNLNFCVFQRHTRRGHRHG